jgi:hypothetical protein
MSDTPRFLGQDETFLAAVRGMQEYVGMDLCAPESTDELCDRMRIAAKFFRVMTADGVQFMMVVMQLGDDPLPARCIPVWIAPGRLVLDLVWRRLTVGDKRVRRDPREPTFQVPIKYHSRASSVVHLTPFMYCPLTGGSDMFPPVVIQPRENVVPPFVPAFSMNIGNWTSSGVSNDTDVSEDEDECVRGEWICAKHDPSTNFPLRDLAMP